MGACELCGGSRWETLEAVGATRVVRCACGLVFVTPPPPRPSLEEAYGRSYYAAWEDQARQRARIWRRRMERVEAHASPPGLPRPTITDR